MAKRRGAKRAAIARRSQHPGHDLLPLTEPDDLSGKRRNLLSGTRASGLQPSASMWKTLALPGINCIVTGKPVTVRRSSALPINVAKGAGPNLGDAGWAASDH